MERGWLGVVGLATGWGVGVDGWIAVQASSIQPPFHPTPSILHPPSIQPPSLLTISMAASTILLSQTANVYLTEPFVSPILWQRTEPIKPVLTAEYRETHPTNPSHTRWRRKWLWRVHGGCLDGGTGWMEGGWMEAKGLDGGGAWMEGGWVEAADGGKGAW